MTPNPITILGYDGNTATNEELWARIGADLDRQFPNGTDDATWKKAGVVSLERHLAASAIATYHNHMIVLIAAYQRAATISRVAVGVVNDAYDDLTNRRTTAWHAAHHRYIVAVTAAQAAFAARSEAAAPLTEYQTRERRDLVARFYDQLVPAGDRLTMPDLTDLDLDHNLFTETNRERLHLLSHTITGTVPAGFESEQTPTAVDSELPQTPTSDSASAYGDYSDGYRGYSTT
jgi:hypothetical protein